ncbi:MAG: class I SAM-dependent methyltransferase [Rhodobacteraceae bacterium]|nr:class I SAM-dependent methyltransferase [Paracoccaceae bacterium]
MTRPDQSQAPARDAICYEDIYTVEYANKRDVEFFRNRLADQHCERILEVGCGTGRVYEALRDLDPQPSYVGIDYSRSALKYFSERHPEAETIEGFFPDCLSTKIEHDFDAVMFSFNGLSYMPDIRRPEFFDGCQRVLHERGRMLLHFFRFDPARLVLAHQPEAFVKEFDVNGLTVGKYIATRMMDDVEPNATRRTFSYRFSDANGPGEIVKVFDVFQCHSERIIEQIRAAGFTEITLFSDPYATGYDAAADDVYLEARLG